MRTTRYNNRGPQACPAGTAECDAQSGFLQSKTVCQPPSEVAYLQSFFVLSSWSMLLCGNEYMLLFFDLELQLGSVHVGIGSRMAYIGQRCVDAAIDFQP